MGKTICCEASLLRRGPILSELDGNALPNPVNSDPIKKYYTQRAKKKNLKKHPSKKKKKNKNKKKQKKREENKQRKRKGKKEKRENEENKKGSDEKKKGHPSSQPSYSSKPTRGNWKRSILMVHELRVPTEQSEAILGIFRRSTYASHVHCSRKILKST